MLTVNITVIIPLMFNNSILTPNSALDNFSMASTTGLNAANLWKCLFETTFVKSGPNFLDAELEK
jgi:hypothetical protein